MAGIEDWFLTTAQRGNPASTLADWCAGNRVEPLVHGATYFDRLVTEVEALRRGDYLFFTDWRGDPDELMRPGGTESIRDPVRCRGQRGVDRQGPGVALASGPVAVQRGGEPASGSRPSNGPAARCCSTSGSASAARTIRSWSCCGTQARPQHDVAFVGGIDLCHGRRDDAAPPRRSAADRHELRYGPDPPWHDVQLAVRGPVVGDLDFTFRERWNDPTPLDSALPIAWLRDRLRGADRSRPARCRRSRPTRRPAGRHAVQVLRTYPDVRPAYPFAPEGERSIARGYRKAIRRARRLIYSRTSTCGQRRSPNCSPNALRDNPGLHVVAVVPRHPDVDGRLSFAPQPVGRQQALDVCRRAGADRVRVYDVEEPPRHAGLRARQGVHHRRRVDERRLRQLQPTLLDPRLRTVVRGARRHPRQPGTPRPSRPG